MPVLAKQAAEKDLASLKQTFTSSLVLVFSLAVPATAGLMLLSTPIIRLIFEHGAFTAADTLQTADALTFYAIGLFAYSAIKVMVPVFYAIGNTKYPVMGSFLGVAINILTITLVIDQLQHRGIALSTSCAMILNFLFLSVILYRKLAGYPVGYLLKGLAKILVATALMSGGIWGLQRLLAPWMIGSTLVQIGALVVLIGVAVGIYVVGLQLLRLPEFTLLTGKLVQRFRRS
jgi:putative peptidoglycan lipid II flippase